MMPPPLNHFAPPPSQSPFSLKYKQNMEFRREVWYSSNWNLLCESYVLSFNFNAKYCVVNTLLDFKHFPEWIAFPRPYRFELLEGSAKQVSDRRGRRKQEETGPQPSVL